MDCACETMTEICIDKCISINSKSRSFDETTLEVLNDLLDCTSIVLREFLVELDFSIVAYFILQSCCVR